VHFRSLTVTYRVLKIRQTAGKKYMERIKIRQTEKKCMKYTEKTKIRDQNGGRKKGILHFLAASLLSTEV
jgi:hypothetical protein